MSSGTTVAGRSVLVTGANRGVGQALVEEALRRNAKHMYAGTRQPLAYLDHRITYLILDVTNAAQIQRAVERVGSLHIFINNAGLAPDDAVSDRAVSESIAESWRSGAGKALERQYAALAAAEPVGS
jgi:NAD(P)-dependent dehydrogenase (short-subunit alcohol dehydrogenase family)